MLVPSPATADAMAVVTRYLNQVTVVLHHELDHCAQGIACLHSNELEVSNAC